MKLMHLCTLGTILYSGNMFGEEFIPAYPSSRPFGINQGSTISCAADSSVHMVEQKLTLEGQGRSRISRNHFVLDWAVNNWGQKIKEQFDSLIKVTKKSNELRLKYGRIVPEFFNPEDNELIDDNSMGDKIPPLESTGIYLNTDYSGDSFNYSPLIDTITGYSSDGVIAILKSKVSESPTGVSISGSVLNEADNQGRLLWQNNSNTVNSSADHRIVLIGFSDRRSAFLIKNSWNNRDEQKKSEYRQMPWSSQYSRSGFYWLPYEYIRRFYSHHNGLYTLTINFDVNRFDAYYREIKSKMQIGFAPYICGDRNSFLNTLSELKTGLIDKDRNNGRFDWIDYVQNKIRIMMRDPTLKSSNSGSGGNIFFFAKIPLRLSQISSDFKRFYNGDHYLKYYYCKSGSLFPDPNNSDDQWFFDDEIFLSLRKLSLDPYRYDTQLWENVMRLIVRKWVFAGQR